MRTVAGQALLLVSLLSAGVSTRADVPLAAIRDGLAASTEFAAYAKETEASQVLPLLSDPRAGPILRRLWNVEAVLAGRPQGTTDMDAFLTWGSAANAILTRYTNDGDAARNKEKLQRNFVRYQDEMALGYTFLIRSMANVRDATFVRAGHAPDPAEKERIFKSTRVKLAGSFVGTAYWVFRMAGTPEFGPENTRKLVGALVDELPRFQEGLNVAQVMQLAKFAGEIASMRPDPALRGDLGRLLQLRRDVVDGKVMVTIADMAEWQRLIHEKLRRRTRYPAALKEQADKNAARPSGTSIVAMRLDRQGNLVEAQLATGSGIAAFDEAAIEAVRGAAPFPAAPDDVKGESIALNVPILFRP